MSHLVLHDDTLQFDRPVFVDGLPGLGLVGKLAADHLIDAFEMTYFASIECPSLPPVAAYLGTEFDVVPPVRIYADEQRDLLALQSETPVSPDIVADFAGCLSGLLDDIDALPMYVSGLGQGDPENLDRERALYGVSTGDGDEILRDSDIGPPVETGVWSGPTGALLNEARTGGSTALGLIVESDVQFPDPEAACVLLERAVEPIADVDIDVASLREHAAEIRAEKRAFAEQLSEPEQNESSMVEPSYMYQ
ncbi:hypothetical protein C475_19138 [Halosimplex carlsbadense 2-9-1]|uniref:3-isopropylmalate dehydratase n=1 Tax=Halosimplex carlsbadense 2-9-1 TaxID=797114 RepID=M0CGV0_9EURY|nr:PAC2 family protein [Halosimplex carlsbadense]ELZ21104.1 hypothetical protein C475_19138 [Halosimplex carlsbadense 2-9-1]